MNKRYDLGNFICSLREEYGMDQKTLAHLLGVSPSAISQCENGGGIKTEKLFQLSELFGVTIDELLEAKRNEQSLEEKLESLYDISLYDLPELLENEDVETIKEFYNRVRVIKDSFYKLLDKWIFRKVTDDEYKELCFLWQYFDTSEYLNRYRRTIVICFNDEQRQNNIKEILSEGFDGFDKRTVLWELEKIFVFKANLYIDEIIELIVNDDKIEHEEKNIDCGKAMFNALPKMLQDLIYSQIVYEEENTLAANALKRIMTEHGAELLYLPKVKNFSSIDEDIFEDIDGEIEFDESLTNAMRIYMDKCIYDFDYPRWTGLTFSEYQLCIDKNKTAELKALVELQKQNMTAYWEKYKSMKYHIKHLM